MESHNSSVRQMRQMPSHVIRLSHNWRVRPYNRQSGDKINLMKEKPFIRFFLRPNKIIKHAFRNLQPDPQFVPVAGQCEQPTPHSPPD